MASTSGPFRVQAQSCLCDHFHRRVQQRPAVFFGILPECQILGAFLGAKSLLLSGRKRTRKRVIPRAREAVCPNLYLCQFTVMLMFPRKPQNHRWQRWWRLSSSVSTESATPNIHAHTIQDQETRTKECSPKENYVRQILTFCVLSINREIRKKNSPKGHETTTSDYFASKSKSKPKPAQSTPTKSKDPPPVESNGRTSARKKHTTSYTE